jgi:molybdopterin-guanine dinucleotide biosynthesis protein MobB
MPPLVSIVGNSGTGKTTLIVKLVRELTGRGYRIATIKDTHHHLEFDRPGKDSRQHLEAGSRATAINTPDRLVIIRPTEIPMSPHQIAACLGDDFDLIITEGFKHSDAPKIEVCRREIGPPLRDLSRRIAVVTDDTIEPGTTRFSPGDIVGLADFLEREFIRPVQPQ